MKKSPLLPLCGICLPLIFGSVAIANDRPTKEEKALKNRQAAMTLIGDNFGPIWAMVNEKMPWDDKLMEMNAKDLAAIANTNLLRAYKIGDANGKTRARPEVWEDFDEFSAKMNDMAKASKVLAAAAMSGERKAIEKAQKGLGKSCKGCHDDYKTKDYRNQ